MGGLRGRARRGSGGGGLGCSPPQEPGPEGAAELSPGRGGSVPGRGGAAPAGPLAGWGTGPRGDPAG